MVDFSLSQSRTDVSNLADQMYCTSVYHPSAINCKEGGPGETIVSVDSFHRNVQNLESHTDSRCKKVLHRHKYTNTSIN